MILIKEIKDLENYKILIKEIEMSWTNEKIYHTHVFWKY